MSPRNAVRFGRRLTPNARGHVTGDATLEVSLAHAQDALVRSQPQIPRAIIDNLAYDPGRQALGGADRVEFPIVKAAKPTVRSAEPNEPVRIRVQGQDEIARKSVLFSELFERAVLVTSETAAQHPEPYDPVGRFGNRPHVRKRQFVFAGYRGQLAVAVTV